MDSANFSPQDTFSARRPVASMHSGAATWRLQERGLQRNSFARWVRRFVIRFKPVIQEGEGTMENEISIGLAVIVEHGREQEAADFYAAAFGARQDERHSIDGVLAAVDLLFGTTRVTVGGANPKREADPSRGGPFFPKAAGAVSTIFQVNVGNLDAVVQSAVTAGATIRYAIDTDEDGRRGASVFDPFGHIWTLIERKADAARLAA